MGEAQRDPMREKFWREALRRQKASGLTVRAFCVREQLAQTAFHAWRRILRERDAERRPTPSSTPAFGERYVNRIYNPWAAGGMLGSMSNPASHDACEKWRQILQRQRASGLCIAQFCRREKLAPSSFFLWKRRLRSAIPTGNTLTTPNPALTPTNPMFVEATPTRAADASRRQSYVELRLRGGRILRLHSGFDPELLINLLRILEEVA